MGAKIIVCSFQLKAHVGTGILGRDKYYNKMAK